MLKFLATFGAILWIVVGCAELVSLAPPPANENPKKRGKSRSRLHCKQRIPVLPHTLRTLQIGPVFHRDRDDITAASTALLAIITALLVIVARRQYTTSQSQLRVYVFLDNAFISNLGDSWSIIYKIKNYGSTPAHNVILTEAAEVVSWREELTEIPRPTTQVKLGSMAPNGDFFENEPVLSGRCSPSALIAKQKAIYLVGKIEYVTRSKLNGGPIFSTMWVATWGIRAIPKLRCTPTIRATTPIDNAGRPALTGSLR